VNKWEALVELARVFADRDRPGLAFATICVIVGAMGLAALIPAVIVLLRLV
jgi:hypothetical protein